LQREGAKILPGRDNVSRGLRAVVRLDSKKGHLLYSVLGQRNPLERAFLYFMNARGFNFLKWFSGLWNPEG